MSKGGLTRKVDVDVGQVEGARILILDPEKCKPQMPAFDFLARLAGKCGKECIQVDTKAGTCKIIEECCLACLNRAKHCPGDAVTIVNLPANLQTNTTHRYGLNSFKLHGLPTPRAGSVLGLLGCNGTGKSTALRVLAGKLKPNLGRFKDPPDWMEVHGYYRGSDLQNYFTRLLEDDLKVVIKPQLDTDFVKMLAGKLVGDVLEKLDERDCRAEYLERLDLTHLVDRDVKQLSGGELQRFAIACACVRDADNYMFDEPSSFLDVRQRMTATEVIRDLTFNAKHEAEGRKNAQKYVVVVEHDLAVLDYISDYVSCLYGAPGAYGVITKIASVRNGINNFLAGYIPAENMRFRAEEISFQISTSSGDVGDQVVAEQAAGGQVKGMLGVVQYPGMSKTLENRTKEGVVTSTFTLHLEPGNFKGGEIIGLLGENGCGKTTFMELLAGSFDKNGVMSKEEQKVAKAEQAALDVSDSAESEHSLSGLGIAYKRQNYAPRLRKFEGTVQALFEKYINRACADRMFRLLVLKPLNMEALEQLEVKYLSGGELQRVAICLCLGTPATVFLLDEPSAGLDCEQRIICAKVIRRWIVSHLQKTGYIVEHDFVMATACSDRVIVYTGEPGVECTAGAPLPLIEGFNAFLKQLDVTFRRDPANFRPRVNKKGSSKDREQKAAGTYFVVDAQEDAADKAESARDNSKEKAKPAGKKK